MEKNRISRVLLLALIIPFVGLQGCKEKEYPVPTASSQAKFVYSVEIIEVDGQKIFEVSFTNQSIEAKSYLWDFGNGNSSTQENPIEIFTDQGDYIVSLTITSANDLHYNKLSETKSIRLLLKETLIMETFDGEGPNTQDTWLPQGWLAVDADGDGINWYWAERQGNGQMRSQSWDNVPLTPDNWLITPEVDLTDVEENVEVWLNFNVCPTANTAIYRTERYAVYVSTTGINPTDFTINVWDETLLESMTNWVYVFRELDLSQFRGEKIRVAFRHYQSTDKDRIVIDDVELFKKF